jgi:hypothetical protein
MAEAPHAPSNNSLNVDTGPRHGWTTVAAAGADGDTRTLWRNRDGRTALCLQDNTGRPRRAECFSIHGDWQAEDIAVGGDQYGPFADYIPKAIECAANGDEFVTWSCPGGSDALWQMPPWRCVPEGRVLRAGGDSVVINLCRSLRGVKNHDLARKLVLKDARRLSRTQDCAEQTVHAPAA